jgi:putative DNA primase/helicase
MSADVVDLDEQRSARSRKAPEGWESELRTNKEGLVKKTIANVELIFRHHDAWRNLIVRDCFAERIMAVKDDFDGREPPEIAPGPWSDVATTRARVWLANVYGIEADSGLIDSVVDSVADRNKRHPVREYLRSVKWDANQRLPGMLHSYFGASDNLYHSEIGKMWMIAGVARVMQPGCRADNMLVLIGSQGTRKSTALQILSKDWGADTQIRIGDHDALQSLHGIWIYEIAELASIKGARDIEMVKGFITSRVDHYRPPYGRRPIDAARQNIFAGSTNESTPLYDTENRRFWTVDCNFIDTSALERDVDQLWAEALVRYESGEPWHPSTGEIVSACREEQSKHTREDPWEPIVEKWLRKFPRDFEVSPGKWERFEGGLTTSDALCGALKMSPDRIDGYSGARMGRILRELGLEVRRPATGGRVRRYYLPEDWDERLADSPPEDSGLPDETELQGELFP